MKATVIYGMSNADYHNDEAIGSSGFKLIERSPLHYWSAYRDPNRTRREQTAAFLIGSAWHCAVFEPSEYPERYGIKPEVSGATTLGKAFNAYMAGEASWAPYVAIPDGVTKQSKEGKALHAELDAAGQIGIEQSVYDRVVEMGTPLRGKDLLDIEVFERLKKMTDSAMQHPLAQVIFAEEGYSEASIFFEDRDTGVRCKIRPDYFVAPCAKFPNGLIVDGKTTDDASPEGFAKSAWNWDMHYQAAFYSDGFQIAFDTKEPPAFIWMAQEKEAPFATAFYTADAKLVAYGRKLYRKQMGVLANCEKTGVWPGYSQQVSRLALPSYAEKVVDDLVGERT